MRFLLMVMALAAIAILFSSDRGRAGYVPPNFFQAVSTVDASINQGM